MSRVDLERGIHRRICVKNHSILKTDGLVSTTYKDRCWDIVLKVSQLKSRSFHPEEIQHVPGKSRTKDTPPDLRMNRLNL